MVSKARRGIYHNSHSSTWIPPTPDLFAKNIQTFHASLPDFKVTNLTSPPNTAAELNLGHLFLKDETCRLGLPSFKILGASWAIYQAIIQKFNVPPTSQLAELKEAIKQKSPTILAATDGNHGRAVARISSILGISSISIYVPFTLDQSTVYRIENEGAKVIRVNGDYDAAVRAASEECGRQRDAILIQDTAFPGYETVPQDIVNGYSTLFTEVTTQLAPASPDLLIVPAGVGSLAQAALLYAKSLGPRTCKVLLVEPDTAACVYKSLRKGTATTIKTHDTIMTGMNCGTVSTIAWPILKLGVDISLTVSDYETHLAVLELEDQGVKVGPCGAAGLAALKYVCHAAPWTLGLGSESVVVLLATEGKREYRVPLDVRVDDLRGALNEIGKEYELAEFIASWLEHRDVDVHDDLMDRILHYSMPTNGTAVTAELLRVLDVEPDPGQELKKP